MAKIIRAEEGTKEWVLLLLGISKTKTKIVQRGLVQFSHLLGPNLGKADEPFQVTVQPSVVVEISKAISGTARLDVIIQRMYEQGADKIEDHKEMEALLDKVSKGVTQEDVEAFIAEQLGGEDGERPETAPEEPESDSGRGDAPAP